MSGMAELLRIHTRRSGIRDLAIHCECGWKQSIVSMASSKGAFAAHQAEMLTAAGFGPVKEAAAKALEDAADERNERSDTLLRTMQNMADTREYELADIVRYGAYSAEAKTTATWLRARAAAVRGEG